MAYKDYTFYVCCVNLASHSRARSRLVLSCWFGRQHLDMISGVSLFLQYHGCLSAIALGYSFSTNELVRLLFAQSFEHEQRYQQR